MALPTTDNQNRKNPKVRLYQFVVQHYTEDDLSFWRNYDADYVGIGYHVGKKKGIPHLHVIVQYRSARYFSAVLKEMKRAERHYHVVACYGSFAANKEYASKDGHYERVRGEEPHPGARTDVHDGAQFVREFGVGRLAEENPGLFVRYSRGFQALSELTLRPAPGPQVPARRIYVLCGEPGTGKTHYARTVLADPGSFWLCPKSRNFPCQGYAGERTAIFDDLRHTTYDFALLLSILDNYEMLVDVKMSHTLWKPWDVVLTMPDVPDVEFAGVGERLGQLQRRIYRVAVFAADHTCQWFAYVRAPGGPYVLQPATPPQPRTDLPAAAAPPPPPAPPVGDEDDGAVGDMVFDIPDRAPAFLAAAPPAAEDQPDPRLRPSRRRAFELLAPPEPAPAAADDDDDDDDWDAGFHLAQRAHPAPQPLYTPR
jgi:hypothetical protein